MHWLWSWPAIPTSAEVMAVAADAAEAAGAAAAAAAPPRYICFLCKRKFKSSALLANHKQVSELHRWNVAKQDEEIHKKKEELRQAIAGLRKQLQDLEVAAKKQVAPDKELQTQRNSLEFKLRQVLSEYGQAQEKMEASRCQQALDRIAGGTSTLPSCLTKRNEAFESRLGRLVLSAGATSWQGNKDVQEDRYVTLELEAVDGQRVVGWLVCDGHSGSLCVDYIMDWLPQNLQKCLSAKPSLTEDHLRQATSEACMITDDEFLSRAREREALDGSTMLLCLMHGLDARGTCRVLLANVGDSRAVLCRAQAGRLAAVRLTDDHKPGRADERRRIESKGGVVDMQGVWRVFTPGPATFAGRSVLWGLAVSRAFGDILMKEAQRYGCQMATGELVTCVPEIHTLELHLTEDRFLVLACDGVWDVLSDEDAVAACMEHRSAALAAHALVRRAFETGSDDNITALVVTWQQPEEAASGRREEGDTKKPRVVD